MIARIIWVLFGVCEIGREYKYAHAGPNDPWGLFSPKPTIKILDVRDGWVKYVYIESNNLGAMKASDFRMAFNPMNI